MTNIYETDQSVSEYLLFHYGGTQDQMPWDFGPRAALGYPTRCVTECFDLEGLTPDTRALDIGCAVGASSFALARFSGEVIGIDYSHAFIKACQQLAEGGRLHYHYRVEGDRMEEAEAILEPDVDSSRVHFEQGDAMNLRPDLGTFDAVLAANLICRLTHPRKFLDRCASLVKPGGQLVINTPFTWMAAYTDPERWVGGHPESGESLDALVQSLEADFQLEQTRDMPFLIREHRRKYQWSVAQSCRFRRKS